MIACAFGPHYLTTRYQTTMYKVIKLEPWQVNARSNSRAEMWLCEKHFRMLEAFLDRVT